MHPLRQIKHTLKSNHHCSKMQDDGLLVTQSTPIGFVEIVSMTRMCLVLMLTSSSRLVMMNALYCTFLRLDTSPSQGVISMGT
ncbi:uncharacterized protein PgNI_00171 [Pyricularia grisea]|uniref:Uncharacterized protein n=1 Tax=Pyricularia grisea TaxID=148305 RepID=A0A6P8BFC4_PYRGI|nr:uncharacterized protein PgNI_00171 [Pyricularia grisea]TLD15526.1 hypothetical protein PgNI_00171 [Pyricularia grisea]